MNDHRKARLTGNLVGALKVVPRAIQVRQTIHVYKAGPDYGSRVAQGPGISVSKISN